MILTERKLRRLIREAVLQEVPEMILLDPQMADVISQKSNKDIQKAASRIVQGKSSAAIITDMLHTVLGIMSIADPTPASDALDAMVYYLQGDSEAAGLVLALSAGGLAAGAATVKTHKVVQKARASKALKELEEVDPEAAMRIKELLDRADGNVEIDYSKVKEIAEKRGENMEIAKQIVKNNEEQIMKGIAESVGNVKLTKKLKIKGTRKQKLKAARMIEEATTAIADSLDSFDDIAQGLYNFNKSGEMTIINPGSPLGNIPGYIIDNPDTSPAMRLITKLSQEYQFQWEEITKNAFPSGMKKEELTQAKTLFEKLKRRFFKNDHNIAKVVKGDLVENLQVEIVADGSVDFAGKLSILDEVDDKLPGAFRISIDVGSASNKSMLRTTTIHEMHHAFDASAAKFIDREIAVMSPQFKEFEDLLRLTIPKNKVPLEKLSDLQARFTNVGAPHPAENHANIMVLKDFLEVSNKEFRGARRKIITSQDGNDAQDRVQIEAFFKSRAHRYDRGVKGKEMKLRPELNDFYNDWKDVYNNPETREEFLDILVNYGRTPVKKSSGVSTAAAATLGLGVGKQTLQDFLIDDESEQE